MPADLNCLCISSSVPCFPFNVHRQTVLTQITRIRARRPIWTVSVCCQYKDIRETENEKSRWIQPDISNIRMDFSKLKVEGYCCSSWYSCCCFQNLFNTSVGPPKRSNEIPDLIETTQATTTTTPTVNIDSSVCASKFHAITRGNLLQVASR